MAIGLWSGGYGMSYPAYTKFSNMQTAKETSPQNQIPDTQQDIEALNLSPIKVDTRVRLDPLMKMQSLETLDMQKAIADMQEDSVLAQYQKFIGEDSSDEFRLDVTPVELQKSQPSVAGMISQDEDGIVILKK